MTLPVGWVRVPLESVAEVRLGRQRSPDRATGPNMVPYLRAANVTWAGINTDDVKEMDFSPKEQEVYRLKRGDVLLSEASGSASEVGKPALWRDEVPGACFQNTLIRVRSKGPLPEFLCYQFLNDARAGRFANAGKGIGINHLGAERMSSWPVVLPPIETQRRIVAKLDALLAQSRAAREQLAAVPDLVETYRQSVLAAAFRGDLTADWRKKNPDVEPASKLLERIRVERRKAWEAAELAKMTAKGKPPKDDKWKSKYAEPEPVDTTGLPALPATWCWASIEQLCPADAPAVYGIIQPGNHIEDGVPYIRPLDISEDGTVALSELKRTTKAIAADYERSKLRTGDLVLSIVGTIGKVLIVTAELDGANITQSSIRIRPPAGISTRFTNLLLQSPLLRRQYDQHRFGNAVQRLNVEHVRNLVVPVVPTREAEAIVATSEECLGSAGRVAAAIDGALIGSLERALLAKAFSGELDLDGTDAAHGGSGRRTA